ncbi:sodium-coupled neutral amino acid transporter 7-like [Physella acuta]|uniref:sodium-coupled neutral amino acid transporter 7-like n=1 Tax=Physella acuta TaxID=109671 RepID=UPI0027DD497E|nr:sodium-coupled neutral amino acid transporter 7-like [Physella acuta]XP_059170118.1 sodium-coupled neutral amino acid transporter 7-like [Physella acuta]
MSIQGNSVNAEYLVDGSDELKPLVGFSSSKDSTSKKEGSGWFVSAFLVVNAALGAGLLNFPIAYHQAGGVFSAVIVQSFFLVFVVLALLILGYCSDIKGCNTYQDVVLSICGPKAQLACAISVLLYCFGTCITFLIIIGDQWELFFLEVAHDLYCKTDPFYMTRAFIISVTSIAFILPLCFPKRIDFLRYASIVGVIGILYVVGLVTIKYFLPHDNPGTIATGPHSWIDVFLVVPDICFAYQCHVSIIPIYSCMGKRNIREFSKTVTLAMILCIITYTVTAALGYLQFGDTITNDILLSFNPTAEVMVAVVLVAVKTYTTYPILCFCGKAAFDTMWSMFWKMSPEEILHKEKMRRVITTLVWFTLTLLLSIFIPNIGVVIQILGAFAAVFIFVFPGMCLLKTMQNRIESGEAQPRKVYVFRWIAIVFLVLGVFIFGLTLSQAIMKDIQGAKPDSSKFTCS